MSKAQKLTDKEWHRVFQLRCKSKQGGELSKAESALVDCAFEEDEDKYGDMELDVFNATVLWKKIKDVAASTFERALEEGFLPSEAADLLLQDPEFVSAQSDLMAASKPSRKLRSLTRPLDPEWFFPTELIDRPVVGEQLRRSVGLHNALVAAILDARENPVGGSYPRGDSIRAAVRLQDPLSFLSDSDLPSAVVRGGLAAHRSYAMFLALCGMRRKPPASFHAIEAAAGIWEIELRKHLVLLASSGISVSEEIVPVEDHLDLDREFAEHRLLIKELSKELTMVRRAKLEVQTVTVTCPYCYEPQSEPASGSTNWTPDDIDRNQGGGKCVACGCEFSLVRVGKVQAPRGAKSRDRDVCPNEE